MSCPLGWEQPRGAPGPVRAAVLSVGWMEGGFRGFPGPHEVMMALLMGEWQKMRPARWEGVSEAPVEPSMLEGWWVAIFFFLNNYSFFKN